MPGISRRRFITGSAALGLAPLLSRFPAIAAPRRRAVDMARVAVSSLTQPGLLDRFDVLCGQSSPGHVDVVLWPGDERRLSGLGVDYEPYVAYAMDPYGLAGYRQLADYEAAMHSLASRFPDRARVFTLPERTHEGRPVYGVEIASNVNEPDGRPCFYMDGLHHAREWPSGEVSMLFAIDLAEGYGTDARIRRLVDAVRTIVVPVVNPDGFDHSRRSAVQVASAPVEGYWRKNRRGVTDDARLTTPLADPTAYGVDPNRNYLFHWGGPGTSPVPADQTYCGDTPFSEPESRNVRSVLCSRPVTAVISNHTYSNLIIRPWGDTWEHAPDEGLLASLGEAMAATNGYSNIKGLELYATTGTTSDYAYAALGALAYTFEHGRVFHPPFNQVPGMYAGTREAFLLALEAAADPRHHSIVVGRVMGSNGMLLRARLNVTKEFAMPGASGIGGVELIDVSREMGDGFERIDIPTQAGDGGRFELHLGPSTRPIAASAEAYTIVFSAPGYERATRQVAVGRGQRVDLGDVVLRATR